MVPERLICDWSNKKINIKRRNPSGKIGGGCHNEKTLIHLFYLVQLNIFSKIAE